jgi:hypothetical protein
VKQYGFDIECVKDNNIIVVDALSKRPSYLSMIDISKDWKSILLVEYSKNIFHVN